jgi:hypothetical protein
MSDITLRAELIQRGFGTAEIARLVRAGELARLRRGAYGDPSAPGTAPAAAHRALVLATVRQVSDEAVVSHGSAAVLRPSPEWWWMKTSPCDRFRSLYAVSATGVMASLSSVLVVVLVSLLLARTSRPR